MIVSESFACLPVSNKSHSYLSSFLARSPNTGGRGRWQLLCFYASVMPSKHNSAYMYILADHFWRSFFNYEHSKRFPNWFMKAYLSSHQSFECVKRRKVYGHQSAEWRFGSVQSNHSRALALLLLLLFLFAFPMLRLCNLATFQSLPLSSTRALAHLHSLQLWIIVTALVVPQSLKICL